MKNASGIATSQEASQRTIKLWIAACSDARLTVAWAALWIFEDVLRLKLLDANDIFLEIALGLSMMVALLSAAFIHPWNKKSQPDMTPTVSSLPRLKATTIFSLLAACCMILGLLLGMRAGGRTPSIGVTDSAAYLAATAQHLAWLWRSATAGLAVIVAAAAVQPWSLHLGTGTRVCALVAEAGMLFFFIVLHNTFAAVEMLLLHLVVANVLLANDLWQSDELGPNDDEEWGERHAGHD